MKTCGEGAAHGRQGRGSERGAQGGGRTARSRLPVYVEPTILKSVMPPPAGQRSGSVAVPFARLQGRAPQPAFRVSVEEKNIAWLTAERICSSV